MSIAVFLDRDGTLNVEKGYIRELENLELIPGAAQAVKRLNDAGILTFLTTNQTGPARGYYDEAHVNALNDRVIRLLNEQAGARLDAVYYCPHLASGSVAEYAQECTCRKPETGMIDEACGAYPDIDRASSFVLGDKATDVDFAYNAGCQGILLKTGYGQRVLDGEYQSLSNPPHYVCDSIVEAVEQILTIVNTAKSPVA